MQLSLHEHAVRKSFFIALRRIRRSLPGKEEWNREDGCAAASTEVETLPWVEVRRLYSKKSFSLNLIA